MNQPFTPAEYLRYHGPATRSRGRALVVREADVGSRSCRRPGMRRYANWTRRCGNWAGRCGRALSPFPSEWCS